MPGVGSRAFRVTVAAVCAYETVAITTGRVPTISTLCKRYPVFRAVIVGGLEFHLST